MKLINLGLRAHCARSLPQRACLRGLAVTCLYLNLCVAVTARADDRYWRTSTGGSFSSSTHWSTTSSGATGATPPAAADTANFALNSAYTVGFGAAVTNSTLNVSLGTVTLDLNGNSYTITGATGTIIGSMAAQTGRLTITDGTLGVDTAEDRIRVGAAAASNGFLTVTTGGRLGNGVLDPDMFVGESGTGTLTVDDNGRADVGFLNVGQNEGATGTVTLNGPNAVIDASKSVALGFNGTGMLNVQNGGSMSTASYVRLGFALGSNGIATVTGFNSSWSQGSLLTVGDFGNGSLSVQAGGSVSTAGETWIGNQATGVGTVIVTGTDSTWNMANALRVGLSGLGNLVISSGGRATTSGATTIGGSAGSEGNVVITGSGSRWSTSAVSLGSTGTGILSISNGGVVSTTGNVSLANVANGIGRATITGSGSSWNISGALNIAAAGTGTFTVESGATLAATGALTISDPAGAAVGTLNFNGGTITAGGFTRTGNAVFNWTDGTLRVNGGSFNNSGANLTINGSDSDDLPALRLASNAQSLAANLPNLTVGSTRQGLVVVSGGSNFQTTTASLGSQDGGTGSLIVEGANSTFSTTGDLGVGGTTATAGGLGNITLGPGGVVTAGGTLRLWDGGTITLSGGTLRFNNLAANGGRAVFNSGTVQILSNFNANAGALDALLGTARTLGFGRKIETPGNTFNLQSNITASGGTLAGNVLSLSANVVARLENGANAAFVSGITNPTGARIYVTNSTVAAGTTFTNGGELHLAGNTATVDATNVSNTGLIGGTGRINSVVNNSAAGQVRVAAGQRLEILGNSGTNINNGLVDVDGGAIEYGRSVTNSSASPSTGLIAGRDATLRFNGGLANSGALTFSGGVSDVFGDVTNLNNLSTPGRIIVTGGAQANFFDDVVNNGTIQVSAAGSSQSTAVFLGSLSGNGISGGGHVFLEGDTRPGFSPGTMAFGGDVSFGPLSSLDIELAGFAAGTQYDRVTVAQSASLGGTLDVSLLNGFKPTIGSSFQVVTASGGISGEFSEILLPALGGGATWEVNYSAQAVTLSVGGVLGDFNLDGVVDAADYSIWRDQSGTNSLAADASGNGVVDQGDYDIWKANFGNTPNSGMGSGNIDVSAAAAVPEPTSLTFASILCAAVPVLLPSLSRRRIRA